MGPPHVRLWTTFTPHLDVLFDLDQVAGPLGPLARDFRYLRKGTGPSPRFAPGDVMRMYDEAGYRYGAHKFAPGESVSIHFGELHAFATNIRSACFGGTAHRWCRALRRRTEGGNNGNRTVAKRTGVD
jgi:hypothetical protein